jgi:hypothetical protein
MQLSYDDICIDFIQNTGPNNINPFYIDAGLFFMERGEELLPQFQKGILNPEYSESFFMFQTLGGEKKYIESLHFCMLGLALSPPMSAAFETCKNHIKLCIRVTITMHPHVPQTADFIKKLFDAFSRRPLNYYEDTLKILKKELWEEKINIDDILTSEPRDPRDLGLD